MAVKRMTTLALEYKGKSSTYIKIDLLHKAPKRQYPNDIIRLSYNSLTQEQSLIMTPKEALTIATGLLNALTINKKGLLE